MLSLRNVDRFEAKQGHDSLSLRKIHAGDSLDDGLVGKKLRKKSNTKERVLV